jgi:hypothetical protein
MMFFVETLIYGLFMQQEKNQYEENPHVLEAQ